MLIVSSAPLKELRPSLANTRSGETKGGIIGPIRDAKSKSRDMKVQRGLRYGSRKVKTELMKKLRALRRTPVVR